MATRPSIAHVAPGHPPHGQLRYLWQDNLPAELFAGDALRVDCPAISLVALPHVEVRSDWTPYADGEVVGSEPIYPDYVRRFYEAGNVEAFGYPEVHRVRRVNAPTYVVSHFNMRTYGHFLLEVLTKLLVIRQLYDLGLNHRIAFPASQPGLARIVSSAFPEARLLFYEDRREKLLLRSALLPTMPISESGHLHDLVISAVKLLSLRLTGGQRPARKLFISRQGHPSYRILENEAELTELASRYGFDLVRPERLPWAEQVALFSSASHVIGEFSSALHGTLFCPPSTKVVCLNWMAGIQSAIATSAGHEIGYLMPAGGVRTPFTPNWREPIGFRIDPVEFETRLRSIGLNPV